jgi:hypothetical protein
MFNKEISPKEELPLYEVEEITLVDAMMLFKRYGRGGGESSITRAAERRKPSAVSQLDESGCSDPGH